MKSALTGIAIISLFCFVFIGCKKDSKNESTKNYLKVDGVDYEISKGLLINYGENNMVYNIDLYLFSPGLTVHETDGYPDSISGTGHMISFEILTTGSDKLALGDYTYSNQELAGTFYYADYLLNWNSNLNPMADFVTLNAGTVKVIKNGTEYELSFTGKDVSNKAISGYYKGSLKYYTDYKKSAKAKHLLK